MKKKLLFISLISLLFVGVAHASQLGLEPTRFETSLVAPISSTATSMTLVSGLNNDGTSLSGFQCFTIDSNQPNVEDVCGTVNGVFVTNMTRGISGSTGTTSVASLESPHRRGADVKTSDEPFLVILSRIVNQIDGFANPIGYDGTVATSTIAQNGNSFVDVNLLNSTAFNGASVINATTGAKGVVQLATGAQAASSTATGSTGASLVLTSGNATSTGGTTAALHTIIANNAGSLDQSFLPASTTVPLSFSNSTYFGTTYSQDIGKHEVLLNSVGTTSWAVPTGIHTVFVRIAGGGGGGYYLNGSPETAGGGSGGYVEGMVNVQATSSLTFVIGGGGTSPVGTSNPGNYGATTTLYTSSTTVFMQATGGQGGQYNSVGNYSQGGTAGYGTGGTFYSNGQNGTSGGNLQYNTGYIGIVGIGGTTPIGMNCGGGGAPDSSGYNGCALIYY